MISLINNNNKWLREMRRKLKRLCSIKTKASLVYYGQMNWKKLKNQVRK